MSVLPIADVAPLFVGIRKGFFADRQLKVKPQFASTGSAVTAAVMSGDANVGFASDIALVIASSRGLPVTLVAAGNQTSRGAFQLLVARDSPIRSAANLEGKTIAVPELKNIGPLAVNGVLAKAGVEPSQVSYLEVPFPDEPAALASGQVDAAWMVEPFITQAKHGKGGVRVIASTPSVISARFPISSYFSSQQFAREHADVVKRFQAAMARSLRYSEQHPDEVRAVLPTYTKIPPDVAKVIALPHFRPDPELALIRRTAHLSRDYGYQSKAPDYDALLGGLRE